MMTKLTIKGFSCIDHAELTLKQMVILIGPQASGKSVISKLLYFFLETLDDVVGSEFEINDAGIETFTQGIAENFKKRFPPQAWGNGSFNVEFEHGPFHVAINRTKPRKSSSEKITVKLSESVSELYQFTQNQSVEARQKAASSKPDRAPDEWDLIWKVRQSAVARMKSMLREEFISHQFFIPAGRSFFTSMGKAVVAFEHMGSLDALTVRFGKVFLSMRDSISGRMFFYPSSKNEKSRKEELEHQEVLAERLFSGKIRIEKNEEYIESKDGRKTPFSLMSSGQQELLSLWITINQFLNIDQSNMLIYIEEPEAHLFPSAQGILMEHLSRLTGPTQRMFITTHSPYILSKLNNFLKAGILSEKLPKREVSSLEKILPKQTWIKPGTLAAYAIIDRKLVDIVGDDGLIDGEYLDGVSGDLSQEFNAFLEIEYAK